MISRPIWLSIIVSSVFMTHHCGPRPEPVEPVHQDLPAAVPDDRPGGPRGSDRADDEEPVVAEIEKCRIVPNKKIIFLGDPHISPDSYDALDAVAEVIKENPALGAIRIEVHTDSQGLGAYNKALSEERAQNVRSYLVEKGVPEDSLIAVGCGEDEPIASNETEEGRAQNRRVEFHIVDCEEE